MRGGLGPTVYSAAKAGVINLTRCAAVELANDRIRVNCICPGAIETPIGGRRTNTEALADFQPLRRAGQADDIARMALFLASDESEWITGTEMRVDGGFMARAQVQSSRLGANWTQKVTFMGPSFQLR